MDLSRAVVACAARNEARARGARVTSVEGDVRRVDDLPPRRSLSTPMIIEIRRSAPQTNACDGGHGPTAAGPWARAGVRGVQLAEEAVREGQPVVRSPLLSPGTGGCPAGSAASRRVRGAGHHGPTASCIWPAPSPTGEREAAGLERVSITSIRARFGVANSASSARRISGRPLHAPPVGSVQPRRHPRAGRGRRPGHLPGMPTPAGRAVAQDGGAVMDPSVSPWARLVDPRILGSAWITRSS